MTVMLVMIVIRDLLCEKTVYLQLLLLLSPHERRAEVEAIVPSLEKGVSLALLSRLTTLLFSLRLDRFRLLRTVEEE